MTLSERQEKLKTKKLNLQLKIFQTPIKSFQAVQQILSRLVYSFYDYEYIRLTTVRSLILYNLIISDK